MPGAELDPDHLPEPLEKAISTTIKLIEDWGLIALISAVVLSVVINRLRKWRVHKQVRAAKNQYGDQERLARERAQKKWEEEASEVVKQAEQERRNKKHEQARQRRAEAQRTARQDNPFKGGGGAGADGALPNFRPSAARRPGRM